MARWNLWAISAALLFAASGAARAVDAAPPPWREIEWPFLRDAWPNGRAFQCKVEDCGGDVRLYARVKVGFCDCAKGVADDEEIDRVGDVDLVSGAYVPLARGEPADVAGMPGRTRLYATKEGSPRRILVFAGGRNCNAFIAMAVSADDITAHASAAVSQRLADSAFLRWIEEKEGGR